MKYFFQKYHEKAFIQSFPTMYINFRRSLSSYHILQSSPYEEVNKPQARHEGQDVTIPGSIPQTAPGAGRPLKVKGKGGDIAAPCQKAELLDGVVGG